jgi:succinylglutamate desuccinylase
MYCPRTFGKFVAGSCIYNVIVELLYAEHWQQLLQAKYLKISTDCFAIQAEPQALKCISRNPSFIEAPLPEI